ncbi:MAG: FAD-dependent oxidoreductase, partial [Acidobacteriota bacterium]
MKTVAVVGSGVSGLVAAWLLQRRYEVEIFEADAHVGGHVYTVSRERPGRGPAAWPGEAGRIGSSDPANDSVDMGFIVHNERTYPLFCRLMRELGVATEDSDMGFSVRSDSSALEYNGSDLGRLFAQRRNLVRPSFYSMIRGILRFHKAARKLAREGGERPDGLTIGEFLRRERFSKPFIEHYLLPMTAAIWSTPPRDMLDFPASTLARFLDNHGMLTVDDRPQWRVITGGSRRYVERLLAGFRGAVHANSPVHAIRRPAQDRVELALPGSGWRSFDAVVLASHSDQSLRLLEDPTRAEREVLGAIPYRENGVTLHQDPGLMPRRRRAWASWNYHLEANEEAPRLTYWMNLLQNFKSPEPYLVTLNSDDRLDPAAVRHRCTMAHPQFGAGSDAAKARWPEISGSRTRTLYCGAYWGNGFHEDGVRSAVRVAQALGVEWDRAG